MKLFKDTEPVHINLIEVDDARPQAGALFQKSFQAPVPDIPRHFLLLASNEAGVSLTIGYGHVTQHETVYLGGGMCVDMRALRQLPKDTRRELEQRGGVAFTLCSSIVHTVQDCEAVFAYVGHPAAYKIDMAVGFIPTEHENLVVYWKQELSLERQQELISAVNLLGPF